MNPVLTTCPYCGTGCMFHLLKDENDRLCGVEPSSTHPVTRGALCAKGWNAFNFVDHPDRLTAPLIRENGKLGACSWEDAIDRVVTRLKDISRRHGPDSIMFFSSAKTTNEENFIFMKLARAVFKTNNVDHCARLCHASTVLGLASTFGSGAMTNSISCIDQADLILVTGSNTTEQHPLIGSRILQAVKRGARLVVADNRKIRLSRSADIHIRQKSGTDVALLNGFAHVLINENLFDTEFVNSRTEMFDEFRAGIEPYNPKYVSEITGVPEQEIVDAARMFGKAGKAMIVYSMGITQHTHGVDNVKACANLAMLTGNVGIPGTGVNPLRGQNNVQGACDMGALPNVFSGYQKVTDPAIRTKFEKAWNVDSLPANPGLTVTDAVNAAADGKIKAIFVMGENPMMSDPDITHVRQAMENLEFLVVQDIFPTETSAFADVILPAACYAEKDGTFTSTERRVQRVRKAVKAPGSALPDWEIIRMVAARAGCSTMNYANPSEIMDEIALLTPIYGGISYERIENIGLQWPCPDREHAGTPVLHSGKFSRGLGCFMPVVYRPPAEEPDAQYPFRLSTGRCYFHFHTGTMTRRTQLLEREERFPYVEMNQADATRLNVRNHEYVSVETRRGEVKAMARVGEVVMPGALFMPFHFAEGPANVLTNNALDPEAKIPEYKMCAAQIRKIR